MTPFLCKKCFFFAENQNNNILPVDGAAHDQVVPNDQVVPVAHVPLQNEPRRGRGRPRTRRERGNRSNNSFIVSLPYLSKLFKGLLKFLTKF